MRTKKLLFIFLSIIFACYIFIFNAHAETWQFKWENTTVKVPLGESLYLYSSVPRASLYRDNVLLNDAKITYHRDGDWLYYLKDVDTSKIGTYKVWYKAGEYDKYKPGTCNGYKALITFEVYDHTPPTIKVAKNVIDIERGSMKSSALNDYLLSNVMVSDNDKTNLDIRLNHSINVEKVGLYKCTVNAIDNSGNISAKSFSVNVFYNDLPSISCINTDNVIYVNIGESIDLKNYINAYDRYDGDLTNKIEYDSIDTSFINKYKVDVSVTNSAGLSNQITLTINVIDEVEPELTLKYDSINLDYKTDLSLFDYFFYVDVKDNNDIVWENLTYETNLCNNVGVYDIKYSYSDGFFNVSKTMNVRMLSYEIPKIIIDDITIKKNSNIDLASFITVYDESDPYVLKTLKIDDSNVIYEQAGTYYAKASCNNSSGLFNERKFLIVIEDDAKNNTSTIVIVILSIVIGLILLVFGIISLIFLIKRKKQTNTKEYL